MTTASFGPLGLEQAPDRAQPYWHAAILGEVPVPWGRLQYLYSLGASSGIDANVDEMSRYALLQLDDGTMLGHRVLSAQMMAELHRPEITVGADWTTVAGIQNLHYALCWFTADVRGVHLVSHNGTNPGFRAAIVLVPSSKAGVVILTNGESDLFTDAATQGLLESVL
jgi:CubicO group peptidase (beta-lactamase class C family)